MMGYLVCRLSVVFKFSSFLLIVCSILLSIIGILSSDFTLGSASEVVTLSLYYRMGMNWMMGRTI